MNSNFYKTVLVLLLIIASVAVFLLMSRYQGGWRQNQYIPLVMRGGPDETRKTITHVKEIEIRYQRPTLSKLTDSLVFVANLKSTEKRVFSQNNEDGVLEAIFQKIGTKTKYYVEFGTENGNQCNTRYFREKLGWKGLMMDGGNENLKINLHKEMIFPNNIVQLFEKYKVPKKFDLLSVDTDFKDFWLFQKILHAGYRPRVIISEFNTFLGPKESKTVPIDWKETRGDFSQYFGFSATAGWHLGRYYGYSMVYCESVGVNCFWVIDGEEGFGKGIKLSDYINGSSLWSTACCLGHKKDPKNRPYTTITADTKYT